MVDARLKDLDGRWRGPYGAAGMGSRPGFVRQVRLPICDSARPICGAVCGVVFRFLNREWNDFVGACPLVKGVTVENLSGVDFGGVVFDRRTFRLHESSPVRPSLVGHCGEDEPFLSDDVHVAIEEVIVTQCVIFEAPLHRVSGHVWRSEDEEHESS